MHAHNDSKHGGQDKSLLPPRVREVLGRVAVRPSDPRQSWPSGAAVSRSPSGMNHAVPPASLASIAHPGRPFAHQLQCHP